MRYAKLISFSIPPLLLLALGCFAQLPVRTSLVIAATASVTGAPISILLMWQIRRNLYDSKALTRFPGGMWFVVVASLTVGAILGYCATVLGSIVWYSVMSFVGCLSAVSFLPILIWVIVEERRRGQHIFLWPDGFTFESNADDDDAMDQL